MRHVPPHHPPTCMQSSPSNSRVPCKWVWKRRHVSSTRKSSHLQEKSPGWCVAALLPDGDEQDQRCWAWSLLMDHKFLYPNFALILPKLNQCRQHPHFGEIRAGWGPGWLSGSMVKYAALLLGMTHHLCKAQAFPLCPAPPQLCSLPFSLQLLLHPMLLELAAH